MEAPKSALLLSNEDWILEIDLLVGIDEVKVAFFVSEDPLSDNSEHGGSLGWDRDSFHRIHCLEDHGWRNPGQVLFKISQRLSFASICADILTVDTFKDWADILFHLNKLELLRQDPSLGLVCEYEVLLLKDVIEDSFKLWILENWAQELHPTVTNLVLEVFKVR